MKQKDLQRIRSLAYLQRDLSSESRNLRLRKDWEAHGDLNINSRPMIRIELWTFEESILPPLMQCEEEEARAVEHMLLSNIVNYDLFRDDTLVPDHIGVGLPRHFIPFGIPVRRKETGGLGHHFISQIADLEEDFDKLGPSEYGFDPLGQKKQLEYLGSLIGDILPVVPEGGCLVSTPTQDIVHIMDMQDMFVAMYDAPDLFRRMMEMLTDDYLRWFTDMEHAGVLHNGMRGEHLVQGSYCFSNEIAPKEGAALTDMWLYMDSQETSGISPEMYGEFVFPYYKKITDRFGMVSYGCCEPVHAIWKDCISTIPNLRKVSISPWCDEEFMGEALRGRRTVYLRKPSPNLLGLAQPLDEEAVRKHFLHTVRCARGCKLEFAQRDVYKVRSAEDVRRYVEIARSVFDA